MKLKNSKIEESLQTIGSISGLLRILSKFIVITIFTFIVCANCLSIRIHIPDIEFFSKELWPILEIESIFKKSTRMRDHGFLAKVSQLLP